MVTELANELLDNNLLQRLGELPAYGGLTEARVWREAATRHTQAVSWRELQAKKLQAPDGWLSGA
jgi:hypothetical protein